jgi:hypothetical protein
MTRQILAPSGRSFCREAMVLPAAIEIHSGPMTCTPTSADTPSSAVARSNGFTATTTASGALPPAKTIRLALSPSPPLSRFCNASLLCIPGEKFDPLSVRLTQPGKDRFTHIARSQHRQFHD